MHWKETAEVGEQEKEKKHTPKGNKCRKKWENFTSDNGFALNFRICTVFSFHSVIETPVKKEKNNNNNIIILGYVRKMKQRKQVSKQACTSKLTHSQMATKQTYAHEWREENEYIRTLTPRVRYLGRLPTQYATPEWKSFAPTERYFPISHHLTHFCHHHSMPDIPSPVPREGPFLLSACQLDV